MEQVRFLRCRNTGRDVTVVALACNAGFVNAHNYNQRDSESLTPAPIVYRLACVHVTTRNAWQQCAQYKLSQEQLLRLPITSITFKVTQKR